MYCHDIICLTETWLTEYCEVPALPQHTCFSAFRPVRDGPGRHSGGVSVYVSDRIKACVELVKTAADGSYLWLKLKHVVLDCPEVYFCACYMPQKITVKGALTTPFECLQADIAQFQGNGAQILICGDMNARTATEADFARVSDLSEFVSLPEGIDELPRDIICRRNCDMTLSNSSTWGPELLELCKDTNLLILNGRTQGDLEGKFTYRNTQGSSSTIDYFITSDQCMTVTRSLQVLEAITDVHTDHLPVLLRISCNALAASHHHTPPPSTDAKFRYDNQHADAYQHCLAHELHEHFMPMLGHEIDVDRLCDVLITCMKSAQSMTMPQACKRSGAFVHKSAPWYDATCKAARKTKRAVLQCPHSTVEQKHQAEQQYHSVTARAKKVWQARFNEELCQKARKDPASFWKVFKSPQHGVCPVSMAAQFEAFKSLMGAEPAKTPGRLVTPDVAGLPGQVSTSTSNDQSECLNADITVDELHDCIKRMKRGKSSGMDGIVAELIKDGGELLQSCILCLFNCMLASHFPERLSVGLITAVHKTGDKSDMSNYRGITVNSVVSKLFAMILEQRIAKWADEHGVKARGQAGFRKDHRTVDNIYVLRALIDRQKQLRLKGIGSGKLYTCFVDFRKAFDTVPRDLLWQVLEELGVNGRMLQIIKSIYANDSAAVRTSEGISEIFRCLLGVKQGCPLSPTLFGLYIDGLEQHLLQTAGIDAPTLSALREVVPLLLYADDLILISTTAKGLQQQLDALASFCQARQLDVNHSKTKVVIFETRRSSCQDFTYNGIHVDREDSYKYLGFTFHATKSMAYGVGFLVAAAKKAMHAMQRRCAFLRLTDPAVKCQLFDTLVLPVLSYACEVWATDPDLGQACETLHRQFLRQLLGVRKSVTNEIPLAEFGRFPLQIHFWQQVLRYHNRATNLPPTRLVSLALIDGLVEANDEWFDTYESGTWRSELDTFLQVQPGKPESLQTVEVASIVKFQQQLFNLSYRVNTGYSSLALYRTIQADHQYAKYLSAVKCYPYRRLISRFRSGCHGLRVDSGRFGKSSLALTREQRCCEVCGSLSVEDEHHFLFDCPAYDEVRSRHADLYQLPYADVGSFLATQQHTLLGRHLKKCFSIRQFRLRRPPTPLAAVFIAWTQLRRSELG